MFTSTIQQLAAITDAALFERIATSVLRSANPTFYANLSHQGVNTDGKTVKAPLDNIGWTRANGESMCVAVAHTTASREDLRGKWLHDPSTVKPRKPGAKPTQPAGDLVKAIKEITNLREQYPGLKATLALTCNREEPTEVRLKAEALADAAAITLDIWSVSRIAQYLDTTAEGQAIRSAYLGIQVNLLSKEELLRVGTLSLTARHQPTDVRTIVARDITLGSTGHVLLSGASGMGKTTICFEALRSALAAGQPGIILNDQTVRNATSIDEAIDTELRRYLPQLEQLAGTKALELCTELKPFVVVVEDINRAEDTIHLLNKLASWALHGMSRSDGTAWRKWRLLCPVWPRYLAGLENAKKINDVGMTHVIGLYSDDEAREAVKCRGEALGCPQNDLAASAIARALGHDPLLIGLYNFERTEHAQDVIREYLSREFDSIALSSGLTPTDLEKSVNVLMSEMLERKRLNPTWREVLTWLGESDDLTSLRILVAKGSVLRLNKDSGQEAIETRHDRILHLLLANFIATNIETDLQATYLTDPYFAEFVGTAVSLTKIAPVNLQFLMRNSPLIAFFAFKDAVLRSNDYALSAARVIEEWLCMESTCAKTYYSRRAHGLQILSELDSPTILKLTDKFPRDNWHQSLFEARFRNGDIGAALNWLTEYPFEVSIGGRQELVDHVRNKYGLGLLQTVEKFLEAPSSTLRTRRGALYLAGYLADPVLAKAVRKAWQQTKPEERDLEAFLWAAARVCGDEADITLRPVCDAWEALPEKDDSKDIATSGPTRSQLAAHGISWKFRDHIPRSALQYFVQRAKQSEALKWPIAYMLRGIDDPIAVQYEIEYLAERSRQGANPITAHFLNDEWRRQTEEYGRTMSEQSKQRLLDLATDIKNDEHLRKHAFSLWEVCISPGDLAIVHAIKEEDSLYEKAIFARVRRRDLTVVPELLTQIKENPRYWWQAGRYIWVDELTVELDASLQRLGDSSEEGHDEIGEWIFPELLLSLDLTTAERLLLNVWPQVRMRPRFVQVALCLATPKLVTLANAAISDAIEPHKFFEHFSFTAGLRISGRPGLTRPAQLDVLRPHLHLLSELDIIELWEACNRRNWRQYRREYLDPILLSSQSPLMARLSIREPFNTSALDEELTTGKQSWAHRWLEDQQHNGAERKELITALLKWVEEKASAAALAVIAQIFSRDATRAEFAMLQEVAVNIDGHETILESTRFDVFYRTLV